MPNLIELGYEPESDFCEKCEKVDYNINSEQVCGLFCEKLKVNDYDHDTGEHQLLRCTECKDSEQAAKQMIPREEVEKVLKILSHDTIKHYEIATNKEYSLGIGVGVDVACSRLENLLKEKE